MWFMIKLERPTLVIINYYDVSQKMAIASCLAKMSIDWSMLEPQIVILLDSFTKDNYSCIASHIVIKDFNSKCLPWIFHFHWLD